MKICIVDDDPNIVELYGAKLKSEGFEVISASDGEEGLELIKKEMPDLVLLDIMMPKKDGLSVLKDLRNSEEISRIPVIVLSNVSDDETATKIGEFSTSFFVVKSLTTPQKIVGLTKEALV